MPGELLDSGGARLQLGAEIGKGGEGAVYRIQGRPDAVAKIYHKPISAEKAAKIEAMVPLGSGSLSAVAAWPLSLVRTDKRQPIGILMPIVNAHKDVHALYSPKSRRIDFPAANWRFLIHVSNNIARAFAGIHDAGYVIGDVNHGSVLVADSGTVKLIDCDSFQIQTGGRLFLCDVGVPTFTPPELQGQALSKVARSPNHDSFGLAVMIFHLLFMGRHPFAGRFKGAGDMPVEKAIAEFRFAYSSLAGGSLMSPPPNTLPLIAASSSIALLFERAFSRDGVKDGVRPRAREWMDALSNLSKGTKRCDANAAHHHLSTLATCPWCKIEGDSGVALFGVISLGGRLTSTLDPDKDWAIICRIQTPGFQAMPSATFGAACKPSQEVLDEISGRWPRKIFAWLIVGVSAFLLFGLQVSGAGIFYGMVTAIIVALMVGGRGTPASVAQHARAAAEADLALKTLKVRWDKEASNAPFEAKLKALRASWETLRDLPNLRAERLKQLETEKHKSQLLRYLDRVQISSARISGIGPGRLAMLASYGIETAADITQSALRSVPRVGPVIMGTLMDWRTSIERGFRFDPTQGIDPHAIAQIDRDLAQIRSRCEAELRQGIGDLERLRQRITSARSAMTAEIEIALRKLAQAQANLTALRG
jgi:DNA-binding helix-hairpin-helix protein with protein kinase domain